MKDRTQAHCCGVNSLYYPMKDNTGLYCDQSTRSYTMVYSLVNTKRSGTAHVPLPASQSFASAFLMVLIDSIVISEAALAVSVLRFPDWLFYTLFIQSAYLLYCTIADVACGLKSVIPATQGQD